MRRALRMYRVTRHIEVVSRGVRGGEPKHELTHQSQAPSRGDTEIEDCGGSRNQSFNEQ